MGFLMLLQFRIFPRICVSVHFLSIFMLSLRGGPFYLKIQAQAYFLLLFYLLLPFLCILAFSFAFPFWKYSRRNRGGIVRAIARVLVWKEFLYSVNGCSSLGCVLSSEFQSFQAFGELKRILKISLCWVPRMA